ISGETWTSVSDAFDAVFERSTTALDAVFAEDASVVQQADAAQDTSIDIAEGSPVLQSIDVAESSEEASLHSMQFENIESLDTKDKDTARLDEQVNAESEQEKSAHMGSPLTEKIESVSENQGRAVAVSLSSTQGKSTKARFFLMSLVLLGLLLLVVWGGSSVIFRSLVRKTLFSDREEPSNNEQKGVKQPVLRESLKTLRGKSLDSGPSKLSLLRGDMVRVPEGIVWMGAPLDEDEKKHGVKRNLHPRYKRRVKLFWIDRFEVSAGQFLACVEAGACKPIFRKTLIFPGKRVRILRSRPPREPARWVRWKDAQRYCQWAQKRLPTEQEWERAAKSEQRIRYPWGERVPDSCERAIFRGCDGTERLPHPELVGAQHRILGKSPFGVYDMAGNVFEWTSSCFDDRRINARDSACMRYVIRGGSYRTVGSIRTYRRYG
ncbi:MAG: SUMF1/EgtB/PvdO family nonheme iron enzyme, partial [Myxococcota bacterium]